MLRKISIFFPLVFSFLLHFFIIYHSTIHLEGGGNPLIFCWPKIVDKKDLNLSKKKIEIPKWINFSSLDLKGYIWPAAIKEKVYPKDKEKQYLSQFLEDYPGKKENHFYLWERIYPLDSKEEIDVSYKVFVSSFGNVIFICPEKLPLNSQKNLHFQAYIREASFFLEDRFSWTKLEKVVK